MNSSAYEDAGQAAHIIVPPGMQALEEELGADLEPECCAAKLAAMWRAGLTAIIMACWMLFRALQVFGGSERDLSLFLGHLVRRGVISSNDELARLRANGKLSMMKKVGEYADSLLTLPFLPAAYSCLYQLCGLIAQVGVDKTREWLLSLGTEPSREEIIDKIRGSVAATAPPETVGAPASHSVDDIQLFAIDSSAGGVHRLLTRLASDLDPTSSLRFPQAADNAGLVIACRIDELCLVQGELTPLLGFSNVVQIAHLHRSDCPDITNSRVVVVATRGAATHVPISDFLGEYVDFLDAAEQIFPNLNRKCALFRAQSKAGWQTLRYEQIVRGVEGAS